MHNDKLTSCERLKCFERPVSDDASSEDSMTSPHRPRKRKRSTRKREEVAAAEEYGEEPAVDDDDDDARSVTSTRSHSRLKKKLKATPTAPSSPLASASAPASASASSAKPRKKRTKANPDDKAFKPEATPVDNDDMDVDDSASVTSKRAPKGSKATKSSTTTAGKGKVKASMKPASKVAKPPPSKSTSTIEFAHSPESRASPTHHASASASGDERHRKQSVSFADTTTVVESGGSTKSAKPRRPRTKKLVEVVASSVDGEI